MKTKLIILILSAFVITCTGQVSPKFAKDYVGKLATVCGRITGTHVTKSGKVLINFGGEYPNELFTAIIMEDDTAKFTDYNPAEFPDNKKICVRGRIVDYKGKPEIIINNPSQITFPEDIVKEQVK
ncbi:hypothetical protein BH11BAC1_BH11BAC1_29390 [soil metagenome]